MFRRHYEIYIVQAILALLIRKRFSSYLIQLVSCADVTIDTQMPFSYLLRVLDRSLNMEGFWPF